MKWVGSSQNNNNNNNNDNHHHHHHVVLVARISLTLSRHFSLSFIASGRSSGLHPVSSHSCWMYVRAGCPAFARPCVGVHNDKLIVLVVRCPYFSKHIVSDPISERLLLYVESNWQTIVQLEAKKNKTNRN